jgi:hypothetical protein
MTQGTARTLPRRNPKSAEPEQKYETFFRKTMRNLLAQMKIELEATDFSFYLYRDQPDERSKQAAGGAEDWQLDLQNVHSSWLVIN